MINLQSKTLLGLVGTIALSIVFTLGFAITQWKADWQLAHQSMVGNMTIVSQDKSSQLIASLPEQHLFGQVLSKMGDVPITNLQLRVTGIVKVNSEQHGNVSKAYISIASQPSKIYQVGDSLPYGVKVYAIAPHAVILENNGQLEKLLLPRENLIFKKFSSATEKIESQSEAEA